MQKVNSRLNKYIYVHSMKTKHHNLQQHRTKEKSHLGGLEDTASQLSFDLGHHSFYAFKNLHEKPHGSATHTLREETETKLDKANVLHTHINLDDTTINKEHEDIKLALPGSSQVLELQLCCLDEERLLEIVLNKGTETNVRDGGGIAKRITCGFSQKQSGNSDRSEYHGEICLPWYH